MSRKRTSRWKISTDTGSTRLGLSLVSAFLAICLAGCSSLSIKSAKSLGIVGQAASAQNTANIFVSDNEYQRTMDAEAFFHSLVHKSVPEELSKNLGTVLIRPSRESN